MPAWATRPLRYLMGLCVSPGRVVIGVDKFAVLPESVCRRERFLEITGLQTLLHYDRIIANGGRYCPICAIPLEYPLGPLPRAVPELADAGSERRVFAGSHAGNLADVDR